ncbi:MAG: hypothetical protein QOF49_309, partial [Chloroflexota bacterium]|nr:hypothetical protein [Chloroflexota bacterium]
MTLPVLLLILARGGSRRIPGKNLRTVAGMPLVGNAARIARLAAARIPDGPHAIVVSTDDPEIAAEAAAWHAEPLDRPARLATDEATSADAARHALDVLAAGGRRFRAVVLVQPTSPLTDPRDIVRAVEALDAGRAPRAVSVTRSHPAAWHVEPLAGPGGGGERLLAGAFYAIAPDRLHADGRWFDPAD